MKLSIQSNKFPLKCKILKCQLKFWNKVTEHITQHPESSITKIIRIGAQTNINFLKYYEQLAHNYLTPEACQLSLQNAYKTSWKNVFIISTENDIDSKLGTYFSINPDLKSFIPRPQEILETERIIVTRFRTGSHSLLIELGRYYNIPRLERKR